MACDLQGPQFSAESGIFSRVTEFTHFCGISMFLLNSMLASDNGTNTAYFGRVQAYVGN